MFTTCFFGTPDFAVPALEALIAHPECTVAAVVTQPDRPRGRGLQLTRSPVKLCAERHGLLVLQPEKLDRREFLPRLAALTPDLCLVAAYGKILGPRLLALPRLGCFNLHASLLPSYRGAAPINHVLLDGRTETGLTVMRMDEGLDTGPTLSHQRLDIGAEETAGELHDRLARLGGSMTTELLDRALRNKLTTEEQDHSQASLAPKLTKEMLFLDWRRSAASLHNQIRALNPTPSARTYAEGELYLIHRSSLDFADGPVHPAEPGTLFTRAEHLWVATGDAWLRLVELQREGKRRLEVPQFLAGLANRTLPRFS
ncbi:MAG: methionyl-tRNA formyltransferase [Deltaproteobacteria bacterium RIFOXYA12_FULL_61_11]|nr:MAG: methionyl-tRNA formyltransferase [Deltaproteobacteria bacterium RIFOXYA12_FULL_61_11]